jgi:hypothetical protein
MTVSPSQALARASTVDPAVTVTLAAGAAPGAALAGAEPPPTVAQRSGRRPHHARRSRWRVCRGAGGRRGRGAAAAAAVARARRRCRRARRFHASRGWPAGFSRSAHTPFLRSARRLVAVGPHALARAAGSGLPDGRRSSSGYWGARTTTKSPGGLRGPGTVRILAR